MNSFTQNIFRFVLIYIHAIMTSCSCTSYKLLEANTQAFLGKYDGLNWYIQPLRHYVLLHRKDSRPTVLIECISQIPHRNRTAQARTCLTVPYTENHNVCHAGVSICVCYRVTTVSDIHKPTMWMCVHSRGGAKRWALSLITRNLQFGRHQWCTLGIALKIPDKLKLLRLRATYVCVCVFLCHHRINGIRTSDKPHTLLPNHPSISYMDAALSAWSDMMNKLWRMLGGWPTGKWNLICDGSQNVSPRSLDGRNKSMDRNGWFVGVSKSCRIDIEHVKCEGVYVCFHDSLLFSLKNSLAVCY